jgi:hypothetical protein
MLYREWRSALIRLIRVNGISVNRCYIRRCRTAEPKSIGTIFDPWEKKQEAYEGDLNRVMPTVIKLDLKKKRRNVVQSIYSQSIERPN